MCADSCLNVKVDDLLTEKAVVCHGSGERGERGATETNNLVCTEKQKHIYGNNTHETTGLMCTPFLQMNTYYTVKP